MQRMTEDEIVLELRTMFPDVGVQVYTDSEGIIRQIIIGTGDRHPVMSDGNPVFTAGESDRELYYGGVHKEFVRWITARGWFPERCNDGGFVLTPAPTAEALAADRARFIAWLRSRVVNAADRQFIAWVETSAYSGPARAADGEAHRRLWREVCTYIQETQA
ncbi:hypothetical protein [Burkholderia pseudomallei]|uniref:hypothetical protein n=1 Tax=Burkholderia pseudomallei TaxID=28450 RepID=UPI000E6A7237|nr:hypothetical protein [Burkholderia pseudomallei]RIV45540.1 hypothetical protein D2W70_27770 [Burkholderia pseudomallei]RIV61809.1 hypothetical protein D2W49_14290 [Burkholderia pseudomallei]